MVSSKDRSPPVRNWGHMFLLHPIGKENWFPVPLLGSSKQFFDHITQNWIISPFPQAIIGKRGLPLARLAHHLSGGKFFTLYCCYSVRKGWKRCWESVWMFTVYLSDGMGLFGLFSSLLNSWCPKQGLVCI